MTEQNPFDVEKGKEKQESLPLEVLLIRAGQYKLDKLMGKDEWEKLQMGSYYTYPLPDNFFWAVYCLQSSSDPKQKHIGMKLFSDQG